MRKCRRIFAAALACILLLSACSQQPIDSSSKSTGSSSEATNSTNTTGFVSDTNLNELGATPICKETVKFTIGVQQNALVSSYEDNYYTSLLEEKGNAELEFVYFPSKAAEATQKLELMISAGGDELPDIVIMGLTDKAVANYGKNKMFISLDNYYENSSYYFKENFERIKDKMDILSFIASPDGNVYSVPQYQETLSNPTLCRFWVYQPWLDKLDIDAPTTTEEYYQMLKAFKEQDPNGNGKADEIPIVGSTNGWAVKETPQAIMNSFIHTSRSKHYLNATDGTLSVAYNTEQWKQGIKYLNKLCTEGLLDPLTFTQDHTQFQQLLNPVDTPIVGAFVGSNAYFVSAANMTFGKWTLLKPLAGPDGYKSTVYYPDVPAHRGYITKNCENPEAAFRILDLMSSEELTITSRWGEKGVNWIDATDEQKSLTFMGYSAKINSVSDIWETIQNTHWRNSAPCFRTGEITGGWYACTMNSIPDNKEVGEKLQYYMDVIPEEPIYTIKYTEDELDIATELSTSLNKYVEENMTAWITGAEDVEKDWDSYLNELEKIGLSDFLKLAQTAYTRTISE